MANQGDLMKQNDFMKSLMNTAPVSVKRKKAAKPNMAELNRIKAPMPTAVTVEQTEPKPKTKKETVEKAKTQPPLETTSEGPGPSSFTGLSTLGAEVYPKSCVDTVPGKTQKALTTTGKKQNEGVHDTRAIEDDWLTGIAASYPDIFSSPDSTKPLRVAAYIRVSTESDNQEDSYETQHDYFMQTLSANPMWTSAGIYSDYGISGTSRERRRGFNRLLRHCEEDRIDRIVTKSISRFARNTADFLKALDILKAHHITISFEKEHLDTAIGQNDLMVTSFGAMAQEESRSISANIRIGLEHRLPKGEMRNVVVYGYRYSGETETLPSGYTRRAIEVVPEEAEVVKRIFTEFVDGKTYRQIARGLNFDHIPKPETPIVRYRETLTQTPIGTLNVGIDEGWVSRHIKQILSLERYCGDVLLQKTFTEDYKTHKCRKNTGELPQYYVKDNHPAIISRELFNEAQKMIEMGKTGRSLNGQRYPFSSRIVCSSCGRFYRTSNRNSRPIWFCPTARNNNGKSVCHAERIYEEQLVRVCRKAVTERFEVIGHHMEREDEGVLNGGITVDWDFTAQSTGLVPTLLHRMEHIHEADDMEHDLTFLGQRISKAKDTVEDYTALVENLEAAKDAALVRHEALGEELADMDFLEEQIASAKAGLENATKQISELTGKKERLEAYWNDLEADYEWRRKAIAWMKGLPDGREGTVEFLNGLTNEYLKAFILYIEVTDPLHYKVRWFDDTWSAVEMYSNVE